MFTFKQFHINDNRCGMKVGTDSVVLGAWADIPSPEPCHVIDIGTGSAILALMVAQRAPHARITAVEIDDNAAKDARANIEASPWASRIELLNTDILTLECPAADLIICNPPFFAEELKSPDKKRALARHGNNFNVDTLIENAHRWLKPTGTLAFVAPSQRNSEIELLLTLNHLHLVRQLEMRQRPDRPIVRTFRQVSPQSPSVITSSILSIRDVEGNFSPEHRALTNDFYLNSDEYIPHTLHPWRDA